MNMDDHSLDKKETEDDQEQNRDKYVALIMMK